jgi:hypothetical protein
MLTESKVNKNEQGKERVLHQKEKKIMKKSKSMKIMITFLSLSKEQKATIQMIINKINN